MSVEQLRKRVNGGFRPFVILTSDGRRYRVPHPEFILIAKRSAAVADDDGYIASIDPLHIVAIKDLSAKK